MGWALLNLIESLGAYILAVGLVLIVANLLVSRFRGPVAGNDPFGGDTLEWSISSPPPAYNYAVIPRISSAYPMWDKDDREADRQRLERGEGLLEHGHQTPATTVQDAELDEILVMPPYSAWPAVTALTLAGVFAMLVMRHYWIALAFLALGGLALLAWHRKGVTV
jgi:cytochrome c oxidase subunit 1/cytochrome c oxidase subunit I+III